MTVPNFIPENLWDVEMDRWLRMFCDVDIPELDEIADLANRGLELFNDPEHYGPERQQVGLALMRSAYVDWLALPYETLGRIHTGFMAQTSSGDRRSKDEWKFLIATISYVAQRMEELKPEEKSS